MNREAKRLHDEALALKPAGAAHDAALCPFCRSDVAQSQGTPSGESRPDGSATTASNASSEGGTRHPMSDISKETHEQLLNAAVATLRAEKDAEIAALKTERDGLAADKAALTTTQTEQAQKIETLTQENTRLNGELDTAQVSLKAAQDEVAKLQTEVANRDQQAQLAEVASKRVEQVKNLGLFPDEYAAKKATEWASLSDDDWAARLDEFNNLRGGTPAPDGTTKVTTDSASALTGARDEGGNTDTAGSTTLTPARQASRSLLGLPS